jgi:putative tryptophan/tyrosine transport system substrate-binding protein
MSGRAPEGSVHLVAVFRQSLGEAGFVEGRNLVFEYRWALGGDISAFAGKQATATIPIVAGMGGDPITSGLVESMSRPGGNVTGTTVLISEMEPKRLGMLRDLAPGAAVIGVLLNPNFPRRQVNYRH